MIRLYIDQEVVDMSESFKYALGSKAKCKITNYEGTIVGRTEWFYGCRRYLIQSSFLKDGSPIPSFSLDEDAIFLLEAVEDKEPNFKYELGSKVRDKITTCEGILQARSQWIHAGNRYNVQPPQLKDGSPSEQFGIEENAIEVIKTEKPHKIKSGGGPSGVAAGRPSAK